METKFRVFSFEDVEVREREFSIVKRGEAVPVEPKAFRVLLALLSNSQKLVTKEDLLDRVWGDTAVTENSLTRAIALLRRLLQDDARDPRFIETVTGVGYRFVCAVEVTGEQASIESVPASRYAGSEIAEAGPERNVLPAKLIETQPSLPRWAWFGAAVGLLTVLGIAWSVTREPAALRVASYKQITYGGSRMGVYLTDGNRLYLNSDSPNVPYEVAVTGGQIVPFKINVPGSGFELVDISPDGTQMLVITSPPDSERYGIWIQSIPGGTIRHLADGRYGSFSPDGKAVLFLSLKGDELYSVNVDGTDLRQLTQLSQVAREPRWTPDGKHIRFERDEKLWEMAPDGSGLHLLYPGLTEPGEQSDGRWSSDGKFYFFLLGGLGGQIWAANEKKLYPWQSRAQPFQLTTGPLHWGIPVPSKDGKAVFATGETVAGELSRFDEKTGSFTPYLNGISAEFSSFSRDGKFVAYVSFPEGVLWKARSDGSERIQLSSPPLYPVLPEWSPDGSKIVFADLQSFYKPVSYVVSSQGGESPHKLFPDNPGLNLDPTWSEDGQRILFHSMNPAGDEDIRFFETKTRHYTVLPGSRGFHSPRWSPDGRSIVALARVAPFLRLFDVESQHWTSMNTTDVVALPCFSKDGKTVYFLRYGKDQGIFRIGVPNGSEEKVVDLNNVRLAGVAGISMTLDPTDAPLITRRTGTDDVYALELTH